MKKRTYESPSIEVINLVMEQSLAADFQEFALDQVEIEMQV